jgi:hypothetical protein
MTPEEYKQNIHVRLAFPLIGGFALSLLMTILGYGMVFASDNYGFDLHGNYEEWNSLNHYSPLITIIFFIIMAINFKLEPVYPN